MIVKPFMIVVAVVCLKVSSACAAVDPAIEARARILGDELRCVVCQSSSINDSQADMARDMRQLVRDKIEAGWSDQQILNYMQKRYGDFILLRPPLQANTWILWLAPWLFGLLAAGIGIMTATKRQRRK